ncbi:hypothetical protein GGX14DRAFT_595224 [Mycena pura]|uniref:Mid2 domain-containing protein n=1 Tax=Mycena pura TaxID=153505 RepID=A0AAD6VNV2_9AGAR|nr:hypothetical protein GGX14DRAFT_595224 [Mycena pura]
MCKRSMSRLWCLLIAFLADTYAQTGDLDPVTAVTLWQFGHPAVLPGTGTPLIPLGTASGGVATTYVIEVVHPAAVTTTDDDGFLTTEAIQLTAPVGTIVASASGWFEPFFGEQNQNSLTIACTLINSAFGDCIQILHESAITLASGPPTPLVFQVSSTVPPNAVAAAVSSTPIDSGHPAALTASPTPTSSAAVTAPPTPTKSVALTVGPPTPTSSVEPSASGSASAPTSKPSSVRTGPIVGGVVGGLVVLGTVVALCVLYRRRRRRLSSMEDGITPRAFTNGVSAPEPNDASGSTHNQGVDTGENFAPQPLWAVPLRRKGTPDANEPSSAATHRPRLRYEPSTALAADEENTPAEGISGLTIPELARMLRVYERVHGHNDQVREDSPPPSYLSAE